MNIRRMLSLAVLSSAAWGGGALANSLDYASLRVGDRAHGFRAATVYLDAADRPMGARFMHEATGFQLDLLRIDSVPQAFTWVKSFATSDMGEPHTQEHLLLLRGVRGRTLGTRKAMSLANSSAYTETWRTSYFFNTTAGLPSFFELFAEQQRAMLHPDYSDAEIALEVRNFGVTKAADGRPRLEEKGPVYNEMVASMANGSWRAWRAMFHAVYGRSHPLGYNQGGDPDAIRRMTAGDIRRFHAATHHLANMGSIAAFPPSAPLAGLLQSFDQVLRRDAPADGKPRRADRLEDLPPPAGDPQGALRVYDYPHANAQQPSPVSVVWPAQRELDASEQILLDLFLANLAGEAGTNLYARLIDSSSRRLDTGARSVAHYMPGWGGFPVAISFDGVRPSAMSDEGLRALRQEVMDELARVAAWPAGSAELKAFNERLASRLAARERQQVHFLGTPPGFGARGTSSGWANLLHQLERSPGERKSLALKPEFAQIRQLLAAPGNPWRDKLTQWRLLGVTPYIVGARPNSGLMATEQAEREARLREETQALMRRYGSADEQEALRRFAADQDADFARIEAATQVAPTPFVAAPPLSLDEGLQFQTLRLAKDVPLVASRFDSMTGASVGLALRLDGVPDEELRALSVLPALLTQSGVRLPDGQALSATELSERLKREVLRVQAGISSNPRTGRVELVLRGAGVGQTESERALFWMGRMLSAPNWSADNLPRLRDLVDQQLAALRGTTGLPEEAWVNDPANAWLQQHNLAWMAAASFQTRAYNALRLRWQLKTPSAQDAQAVGAFLRALAQSTQGLSRTALREHLKPESAASWTALSEGQRTLAREALRDLELSLADIPDASLSADFGALARALSEDLALPPGTALQRLERLRQRLLVSGGARMFLASPEALRHALMPSVDGLVSHLRAAPFEPRVAVGRGLVRERLAQRGADAQALHVGLHAPNKQGGIILTQAPLAHVSDADRPEALLDFLAGRIYGGAGSHGAFSKTVGAGLAYSNGLRGSLTGGVLGYYAERTPELPQTVRFVIDLVKNSRPDPQLAEYVMAQAFVESRASQSFDARAEGIANDLVDGQSPEQVARARKAILALRADPGLMDKLYARKDRVYARVLPGYAPGGLDAAAGSFMVIGPDRQLDAWEAYLKETEGSRTRLQRLYGRDFWLM